MRCIISGKIVFLEGSGSFRQMAEPTLSKIGKYDVVEVLGQGGMGVVCTPSPFPRV